MKKITIISSAILFFVTTQICGFGCKVNAQTSTINQEGKPQTKTVTLKITGMTCGGCAKHVHSSLSKKDGIIENEVKYPGDIATVKYDINKITVAEIIKTIETTGYKAQEMKEDEKKMKGCCAKPNNKK